MPVLNEDLERRAEAPRQGMSTGAKVAMGCGIAAGAVILLVVVGVIIVWLNVKSIAQFAVGKGTEVVIESSSLTDLEKQDAKATVKEFVARAMEGEIPQQEAEVILKELMKGTLGQLIMIGAAHQAVEKSGLTPEEKKRGSENLLKFNAAFARRKLSKAEISAVLDAIPRADRGGPKQTSWTDQEVRGVLAKVSDAVEGKDIQPSEEIPDFAEDLRKTVRAMKEIMARQAAPEPQNP